MRYQIKRTPVNAAMINAEFAGKNVRYASEVGCAHNFPVCCEYNRVELQKSKPKLRPIFVKEDEGNVVLEEGGFTDIVAPSKTKAIQGKRGYVPVKNKFEMIKEKFSSFTLSDHSPAPCSSGKRFCNVKIIRIVIAKGRAP